MALIRNTRAEALTKYPQPLLHSIHSSLIHTDTHTTPVLIPPVPRRTTQPHLKTLLPAQQQGCEQWRGGHCPSPKRGVNRDHTLTHTHPQHSFISHTRTHLFRGSVLDGVYVHAIPHVCGKSQASACMQNQYIQL